MALQWRDSALKLHREQGLDECYEGDQRHPHIAVEIEDKHAPKAAENVDHIRAASNEIPLKYR